MRSRSLALAVIAGAAMLSPASAGSAITITETRLTNGDSRIEVVDSSRDLKRVYSISLSRHHHPATSPNDELVKTLKSRK